MCVFNNKYLYNLVKVQFSWRCTGSFTMFLIKGESRKREKTCWSNLYLYAGLCPDEGQSWCGNNLTTWKFSKPFLPCKWDTWILEFPMRLAPQGTGGVCWCHWPPWCLFQVMSLCHVSYQDSGSQDGGEKMIWNWHLGVSLGYVGSWRLAQPLTVASFWASCTLLSTKDLERSVLFHL